MQKFQLNSKIVKIVLARPIIWGGLTALALVMISLLMSSVPVFSAFSNIPVNPQTPIFATQLQGGFSLRGSPTIADVLTAPAYPGLEIVVGSAATTAAQGSYPASVALIKSDGSIIWEHTTYTWQGNTYSIGTITGSPAVADLDNDGQMDIVVGMGGWDDPLTRGGIIAFNGDGSLKWYAATLDLLAPPIGSEGPNGIPDGVYASPSIADFDGDGTNEVVVGGWDRKLWVLNGATGVPEPGFPIDMWDTVSSSTAVADLDGDDWPDFTFGSDFANLSGAPQLPPNGGVMRGMKYKDGQFYLPGWDQCLSAIWSCVPDAGNNDLLIPIGQWIDQTLFSSPAIGDINQDGKLEIVIGSGFFWSPATTGHWIKIWQNDGSLLKTLDTNGITFASPALGDLNGDGYLDIVAGAIQMDNSYGITGPSTLYAWSGNPADNFAQLWTPQTIGTWRGSATQVGMYGSPIIADIDPGQLGPEILFGFDTEVVVFNGRTGAQLTYVGGGASKPTLPTYGFHENSPAVADINDDGKLEIVITNDYAVPIGSPRTWHQWVVAWQWPGAGNNAAGADLPWPMFRRDAAHHASIQSPTLKVTPSNFAFAYQYGSGDPNPSSSFTIQNFYNTEDMNYTVTYPSAAISLGAPATGVLDPSATLEIPFVVSASAQITGTYTFEVETQGSSGGKALLGSPKQIQIFLLVGDITSIYLPIILK